MKSSKNLALVGLAFVLLCVVIFIFSLKTSKKRETANNIATIDVRAVYAKNCSGCHRLDLGGDLGPNLTDDYWILGNTLSAVRKAIQFGNPPRGMPAFGTVLSPDEITALVTLIKSSQGTTPSDAKPPQGFGEKLND